MTAAVPLPALPRPSPMTSVLGVAVGAVGAAVLGGHVALPDAAPTTAGLHVLAGHSATPSVAPVGADATSASATVPELTKAAHRHQHDAVIEGAIQRFESRIGTTRYEGYCERAVENAFAPTATTAARSKDGPPRATTAARSRTGAPRTSTPTSGTPRAARWSSTTPRRTATSP